MNKLLLTVGATFVLSLATMFVGVRGQTTYAVQNNLDKVTICHRTNSVTNPYLTITVDKSAVDGEGRNDHTLHTGPVATSEAVAQALKDAKMNWGDIIPPFDDFAGYNWDKDGQSMFYNDCNYMETDQTDQYVQFEKLWDGEEIDLEGVEVTFFIGEIEWRLGDDPLTVDPGDELSPLSEVVTGLPEDCSYESDLPDSYTVPEEEPVDLIRASDVEEEFVEVEPTVYTVTVTNTVSCEEEPEEEEEEDGEVLGEVTPRGPVNAGAGSVGLALYGLVGSAATLTAGVVAKRKFNL